MSDLTDLPEWVWDLLDALERYEDEHPILYRMTASDVYERWPCIGSYLGERKAWPPREVQDAAKFRRSIHARFVEMMDAGAALTGAYTPHRAPLTPEQPPADHGDGSGAGGREGGEGA